MDQKWRKRTIIYLPSPAGLSGCKTKCLDTDTMVATT